MAGSILKIIGKISSTNKKNPRVKLLPKMIDERELNVLLHECLKYFPELHDGWRIDLLYEKMKKTYGKVDILVTFVDNRATIKINSQLRESTRNILKAIIFHELLHIKFATYPHLETDIAHEMKRHNLDQGLFELFLLTCRQPCRGLEERWVGTLSCRKYCPHYNWGVE